MPGFIVIVIVIVVVSPLLGGYGGSPGTNSPTAGVFNGGIPGTFSPGRPLGVPHATLARGFEPVLTAFL